MDETDYFDSLTPDQLKLKIGDAIKEDNFEDLKLFIDNNYINLSSLAVQYVGNENVAGLQYLIDHYQPKIYSVEFKETNLINLSIIYGWLDGIKMMSQHPEWLVPNSNTSLYQYTPLFTAVTYNQYDIVEHLLDTNPELLQDVIPQNGYNIVHMAISTGDKKILQLLISRSENTDILNHSDKRGLTPLHRAVLLNDLNMVKLLVEEGKVDVDKLDKTSKTPYEIASESELTEISNYLESILKINYFESISIHK